MFSRGNKINHHFENVLFLFHFIFVTISALCFVLTFFNALKFAAKGLEPNMTVCIEQLVPLAFR